MKEHNIIIKNIILWILIKSFLTNTVRILVLFFFQQSFPNSKFNVTYIGGGGSRPTFWKDNKFKAVACWCLSFFLYFWLPKNNDSIKQIKSQADILRGWVF